MPDLGRRRFEASRPTLITDEILMKAWRAGVADYNGRWDLSALGIALQAVERDIAEAAHRSWPYEDDEDV